MLEINFDVDEAYDRFADFAMDYFGKFMEFAGEVFTEVDHKLQEFNEYLK